MSRLEIILSATLFISAIFNIAVFVYARAAIVRLLSVSEELGDLQQMVDSFAKHLKTLYELEMYYGDETLNGLLKHSKYVVEQIDVYAEILSGLDVAEDAEEQPEEEEEEQE